MKKWIVAVVVCLSICKGLLAQSPNEIYDQLIDHYEYDSAKLLVQQWIEAEPNQYEWYSLLGDVLLYQYKYDSSVEVLKTALSLAPDTAQVFKGKQYLLMAYAYHDRGNYQYSLALTKKSQRLLPESSSSLYRDMLSHLALEYNKLGQRDSGVYYLKKLVEKEIVLNDSANIASTLNGLGLANAKMKNYDKAQAYYRQSLKFMSNPKNKTKGAVLNNIAMSYLETNQLDSIEYFLNQSIAIHGFYYDSVNVAKRIFNLGQYYVKAKALDRADSCFDLAEEILRKKKALGLLAHIQLGRADINMDQGHFDLAISSLTRILEASRKREHFDLALSALSKLTALYKGIGNYEKAYDYLEEQQALERIAKKESTLYKTQELELANSIEQKKRELKLQETNYQLELKNERRLYVFLGLVLFMALVAVVVFGRMARQKNKMKQQLLTEEIDNLRHRISRIISDVTLEAIEVDMNKVGQMTLNKLTEREIDILQLAVTNKSNAEIADEIHLSVNTVKYHLKNIYNKLGVSSKLEAREALSHTN
ncbi:LuxR C-terminal-related transcriptional regulator [Reichenbachiella sp.]|uniref:LuxR C-terminal-related transcriptional regulator n=1 Tax=Reichenbachiella sp. TaxID=2184521 RepID=UPI003B592DC2